MPGSAEVASHRLRSVLDAAAAMSSDLSFDGLLDRILRGTCELVGAERGFLDVLDRRTDRRIGTFAAYGLDDRDDDREGRLPGRQLLVELLERPAGSSPSSFIGVPITIRDFVFGNIYLVGKDAGVGFTGEDEEVAMAMATAAGFVIQNARLYDTAERQRLWSEAAAEITSALLSPIARRTALQLVADRARSVAAADFVGLLMQHDDLTVVEAASGVSSEGIVGEVIDASRGLVVEAVRLGRAVVVPDTELDPRYHRNLTSAWPDLGSLMVLPLRSVGQAGALIVGWFTGHQTDRWELDPVVPQGFADQAALVLQMAQAQDAQARLAVFEDRDRIGRDLHDLVIQRLFGIGLMLDKTSKMVGEQVAVDRLSSAIDDIDETIEDVRRTIFALSSTASDDDLRSELELVVDDASRLLGFRPELRLSGPVDSVVTDDVREHLLAVLRETMSNIVRHAGAHRVVVEVDVGPDICLTVGDDGNGLASAATASTGSGGNGLRNMRERAALLGGTCTMSSEPGQGTTIRWSVPRRP